MEPFKPGDVVEFRNGDGPRMTVERCRSRQPDAPVSIAPLQLGVFCVWFDKDNHLHRAWFMPELLRIYEIPSCSVGR